MSILYKKGFTLIELLVVIAIIGILSSIVLVSLNNARAKGRDAKRVSDMQQMLRVLALDSNSDSATAFGTCTAAHADLSTCNPPNFGQFVDPSGPTDICNNTDTAPCKYSVSTMTGAAGATYTNWQIMGYLEQGAGTTPAGVVCVSYATSTFMAGAANCK